MDQDLWFQYQVQRRADRGVELLVLEGLGGQSIGFLWNSKPNGDLLFERLEKLLREKYEIADVIYKRKPTASLPATDEVLDELAGSVQAVIVGLAD